MLRQLRPTRITRSVLPRPSARIAQRQLLCRPQFSPASSSSSFFQPSVAYYTSRPYTTSTLYERLSSTVEHFKNFHPDADQKESEPRQPRESDSKDSEASTPRKSSEKQQEDPDFKVNSKKKSKKNNKKKPAPEPEEPEEKDSSSFAIQAGIGAAILTLLYATRPDFAENSNQITFHEFSVKFLETGQVAKLVVTNREKVSVYLKSAPETSAFYFNIGSVDSFERALADAQFDNGVDPTNYIPVQYTVDHTMEILSSLVPLVMFGVLGVASWRLIKGMGSGGGIGKAFKVGKAGFTKIMPGDATAVKFSDVAGLDEAKVEIMEFVSFLQDPDRFTRLGAKIPKGALLTGAPGTGKTLLAKATAGEAGVPFFSISGSEFLEMFVGVGPARVRDLFAEARKNKPSIIFIDEIDAVGRSRENGKYGGGGNDERENTLNQLLVEMDGFASEAGIIVLAGTNRPDILDKALLRPGRFDRTITIEAPDIKGRSQIFKVHLAPLRTANEKDEIAMKLAALTPGFSGADIANICNEAALIAARAAKDMVEEVDFEKAVERVIGGLESNRTVLNLYEKKLVAFHEAGHAVAGWFCEHADPVLKVTIIPRSSGSLGFAQYLPRESSLMQMDQLQDKMAMIMGGRAAEQIFFGKISTGASNDIERATQMASDIITRYGMGQAMPNLGYNSDNPYQKAFSEETAFKIDNEIKDIVGDAYTRVLALLEDKRDLVEALAQKLIEEETINHETIVNVLGPRPFAHDVYQEFLDNEHKEMTKSNEFKTEEKLEAAAKATAEQAKAAAASEEANVETEAASDATPELASVDASDASPAVAQDETEAAPEEAAEPSEKEKKD